MSSGESQQVNDVGEQYDQVVIRAVEALNAYDRIRLGQQLGESDRELFMARMEKLRSSLVEIPIPFELTTPS